MPATEFELENLIKLSMQPGGAYDPLGVYLYAVDGIKFEQSWLEESLTQAMTPSQWKELSKLLRGGFNDEAAKLICGVAEAYARRHATEHFERQA